MENRWTDGKTVYLDLRHMDPPEPMRAILREIDGGLTTVLVAYLDREPVPLFPELEERGWTWRSVLGMGPDEPVATVRMQRTDTS